MMKCLKTHVLSYLNKYVDEDDTEGRAMSENIVDRKIYERVGKILNENRFAATLPGGVTVTYDKFHGLDMNLPSDEGKLREPFIS